MKKIVQRARHHPHYRNSHHHSRLGNLLIAHGLLTEEQLEEAIALQQSVGKRLGEILVEKELVAEKHINQLLRKQKRIRTLALIAAALMTPFRISRGEDLAPTSDLYTGMQHELVTMFESRAASPDAGGGQHAGDIAQIVQLGGEGNLAVILQSGSNDKATIEQSGGEHDTAVISQSGNNQTASISQSGNQNTALISQH